MKHKLLKLGMLLSGSVLLSQFATAQVPDYIQSAVDSEARTAEMKARDPQRMPAEILAMSGIEPGDTVLEFAGFLNYYTTMLSEIAGADGQVHMYDLSYTGRFGGAPSVAYVGEHANTSYHIGAYNTAPLPADVDAVFNVLYYHDMHIEGNNVDVAALNKRIFDALKPGGTYVIIDHNDKPGSGKSGVDTVHRIDPAVIKEELMAAGFELAVDSDILAHPEDDHTKGPFTEGMRGNTDRSVFVFKKPE